MDVMYKLNTVGLLSKRNGELHVMVTNSEFIYINLQPRFYQPRFGVNTKKVFLFCCYGPSKRVCSTVIDSNVFFYINNL